MEFSLPEYRYGFHLITSQVISRLGDLPETGLLNLFIKHTSVGLIINENADSTVLNDFEAFFRTGFLKIIQSLTIFTKEKMICLHTSRLPLLDNL